MDDSNYHQEITLVCICHLILKVAHYDEFCDPQTTGAHLAESTAKDSGHVRSTVFQGRVTSSKHVSPLATVRLLEPFSTIGEGRISLMAEVECLDLYTWRRRQCL